MKFIFNKLLALTFLVICYGLISSSSDIWATGDYCKYACPSPSPSPTMTPYPSHTPKPTPSLTPSPSPTPTHTPIPSPTPTVTPTPSPTPNPSPSHVPTPTPSPSPTPTPVPTPTPTPSPTPNPTETPRGGTGGSSNGGGDGGDGRSDGLGCASHDCSGNAVAVLQGQVLGASTRPEVLGLSFTGSQDEGVNASVDLSLTGVKIQIDPNSLLSPIEVLSSPSNIAIPALGIDLPVAEATAENGFWQNFDTVASHGVGSANPGEGSNVVIFAHAKWNLFGNLKFAQVGNEISVSTKNGKYRYQITQIKEVTPDQISAVAPTGEEILTLYTCIGENDEKRLVIIAKPL